MHSKRAVALNRFIRLGLAAAITGSTGHAALAQRAATPADTLDEVVVTTARQRAESLQEVPATITAITASTLESANVQRAGDFIRLTPGVSLVQTAEVADAQVNIRGINGARDAENSFALIIDGVLQTNPAAFNREYADLKQIEVVKGPQAALYGRNAFSGALNYVTAKPTDTLKGKAEVQFGSHNKVLASGSVSGPLIAGLLKGRVSVAYDNFDGSYENQFSGIGGGTSKIGGYRYETADEIGRAHV